MRRLKILVVCEFSGIVRDAFARLGHESYSCDLLPSESPDHDYNEANGGGKARHIQGDIIKLWETWNTYGRECDLMIGHPPCDDLAVSGARWFPAKRADGRQQKSIDFFLSLAGADTPSIAIENPIGIMSSVWRKPDQIIQPWMFGHGEVKATCLWLKNLPKLASTEIVDGRVARVHREPPSPDRWKNRSRTMLGVARAMAQQWSEYLSTH